MPKSIALFGRKKTSSSSSSSTSSSRQLKDYYSDWIETLKTQLLPFLRHSISLAPSSPNLLSAHVEMTHHHFQNYYTALDLAAESQNDAANLLFPDWRNPLEKPFLWLGDFHPYIFTNLLRSFLEDDDDDDGDGEDDNFKIGKGSKLFDKPWIDMAWKSQRETLMTRIDQIECGLRLMVPALVIRSRDVQSGFVERVGGDWERCEGRKEEAKAVVGEAMVAQMEEITGVFMDANRLRKSVLAEIMAALNVYQSALFFEGLAQFLIGFRDHELLGEFERCKTPIDRLI